MGNKVPTAFQQDMVVVLDTADFMKMDGEAAEEPEEEKAVFLPADLIDMVLRLLDVRSLQAMSCTCKSWRRLASPWIDSRRVAAYASASLRDVKVQPLLEKKKQREPLIMLSHHMRADREYSKEGRSTLVHRFLHDTVLTPEDLSSSMWRSTESYRTERTFDGVTVTLNILDGAHEDEELRLMCEDFISRATVIIVLLDRPTAQEMARVDAFYRRCVQLHGKFTRVPFVLAVSKVDLPAQADFLSMRTLRKWVDAHDPAVLVTVSAYEGYHVEEVFLWACRAHALLYQ